MIFLDSSFLVAFYNEKDEHHVKANSIMKNVVTKKYGEVFISDYVFYEFVTIMLVRTKNHSKTITTANDLLNFIYMLFMDKDLFEKAWDIFKNQKNTSFSFTDCTTLAIIRKEEMKYIATFDEDFNNVKGMIIV